MNISEKETFKLTFIRVIEIAIVIKREFTIIRKLFIVPTADFVNCVRVAMRTLELTSVCFW